MRIWAVADLFRVGFSWPSRSRAFGPGSSSVRSLSTRRSVFCSHAWRLRPLRFCLMTPFSNGLGLFPLGGFRSGFSARRHFPPPCVAYQELSVSRHVALRGLYHSPPPSPSGRRSRAVFLSSADRRGGPFPLRPVVLVDWFLSHFLSRAPGRGVRGGPVVPPRGASGSLLPLFLLGADARLPGRRATLLSCLSTRWPLWNCWPRSPVATRPGRRPGRSSGTCRTSRWRFGRGRSLLTVVASGSVR